ncbi:MAG: class I SAM-dependent methyltransferase [archaeon]|nr:class I SAM-dependent methyltransferase [archaeon]
MKYEDYPKDIYHPFEERRIFIKQVEVKNKNVLDVGAGRGKMSILLAKEFKCASITCIDPNQENLDLAYESARLEGFEEKVKYMKRDARSSQFPDKHFDIVLCFNVLHHVEKEDREKVLHELFRITKEELIISDLSEYGAKIFDQFIHKEENHSLIRVDLKWLEKEISTLSKEFKINERKLFMNYICKPF